MWLNRFVWLRLILLFCVGFQCLVGSTDVELAEDVASIRNRLVKLGFTLMAWIICHVMVTREINELDERITNDLDFPV